MFVITLTETIELIVLSIIAIVWIIYKVLTWIEQAQCPHEHVNETMSCDAICRKCGKNLGFIGTWREQHKK